MPQTIFICKTIKSFNVAIWHAVQIRMGLTVSFFLTCILLWNSTSSVRLHCVGVALKQQEFSI